MIRLEWEERRCSEGCGRVEQGKARLVRVRVGWGTLWEDSSGMRQVWVE